MGKKRFRRQLEPYYVPSPTMRLHPVTSCTLCEGTDFVVWKRVGPWTLTRCIVCELCFLNPRPDAKELYADYHERLHIEDAHNPDAIERGIAAWDERVEMILKVKATGRALDLGCASGFFLENLRRRGWEVMGCELADWAAQRARELFGLTVMTGDILKLQLPKNAFDLVTLWDVVEHMPDPAAALLKAKDAAKPNGLIIVRVQNVGSLDARVLGLNWIDWCLPYHFYHFTPKTLVALAEKCGLRVRQIDTGISTVVWEFMFAPLAMPPHHVKLIAALKRTPVLWKMYATLRSAIIDNRFYKRLGARYMPGPMITLIAQRING